MKSIVGVPSNWVMTKRSLMDVNTSTDTRDLIEKCSNLAQSLRGSNKESSSNADFSAIQCL